MGQLKSDNENRTGETPRNIQEETKMKEFDFGYFGTGAEGYAQYKTAFDRNFGTGSEDDEDLPADDAGEEDTDTEEDL